MTSEEYKKYMVEEVRNMFINDTWAGTPYICNWAYETDDVHPITSTELKDMYAKAEEAYYFTDDDGIDGGLIERVALQYNKLLPVENDMDMRDYPSFIFIDDECKYYVFFIDSWPNKKNEEC